MKDCEMVWSLMRMRGLSSNWARQRNVAAFTTSNSGAVTSGYLCFSVWSALFRKSQLHNNPALNAPPSPDYQQDRKPLQWSKNVQAKENNENDTDAG
jgi:hypothetical protein